MRNRFGIAGITAVAFSALALSAWADDEKIAVEKLPAAVKKAIKKRFHKAEIEKATKEVENGKTTYEVLLEIDDSPVDVAFSADGTILEIEKMIPASKLPARVKQALATKYPGAKIEKVEAVTRGEDGPIVYEIAIKAEVVVDAKGKFVNAGEEEDEKPSAKAKRSKKVDGDEHEDEDEKSEKGTKRKKD